MSMLTQMVGQTRTEYKTKSYSISQKATASPRTTEPRYNPVLKNIELPTPGGNSEKSYLMRQKIKSRAVYPIKETSVKQKKGTASNPKVGRDYGLFWYSNSGTKREITGGRPNDNTLAVSNDGIVLSSLNSSVYAYDLNTDTTAFEKQKMSLAAMAGGQASITDYYYDPKLIYDEEADRFILVFLKNNDPETNKIVVCFSTSSDPNDDWNVYEIPGNPLNNNRWTDFPTVSISGGDVFITGNLIIPNVSWQVGFDGSVIWQIEKESGYNSDVELNTKLYSDITYGGKYIRNLHLVRGANGVADKQYLLSNRNFDVTNDTIFVMDIEGSLSDATQELNINFGKSNLNYGVPPNGRQEDTDTSDPTNGLQTNDGRVLAAIKHGDEIQFVSNSMNPATGFSGIYHGVITNFENPEITARIIGDPVKDFGYPNIAWTGNEDCDNEVIIAFNHTSPTDFPGISCVYVDNDREYSDVVVLKEGENYVDRTSGGNERWGDYFGLQRKYNEPGKVYSFGFFAKESKVNTGWNHEIMSPDTSKLEISLTYENLSTSCEQTVEVVPTGGVGPYTYNWDNHPTYTSQISPALCADDSLIVQVIDSRGCEVSQVIYAKTGGEEFTGESTLFPNPFVNQFIVQFELDKNATVEAAIFDLKGNLIDEVLRQDTKLGVNELIFSLEPLERGHYIVKVKANGKEIITEKVVKY